MNTIIYFKYNNRIERAKKLLQRADVKKTLEGHEDVEHLKLFFLKKNSLKELNLKIVTKIAEYKLISEF